MSRKPMAERYYGGKMPWKKSAERARDEQEE